MGHTPQEDNCYEMPPLTFLGVARGDGCEESTSWPQEQSGSWRMYSVIGFWIRVLQTIGQGLRHHHYCDLLRSTQRLHLPKSGLVHLLRMKLLAAALLYYTSVHGCRLSRKDNLEIRIWAFGGGFLPFTTPGRQCSSSGNL